MQVVPGLAQAPGSGGFSLIEILVAVLIVSVGVLGVAGLQLVSLQNNTSAMFRTQAFQAAYEILDRKRANPDQDYTIGLAADPDANGPDCAANVCTPAQMSAYDRNEWLEELAANLPNGDGSVADNGAGGVITITVQWQDERRAGADPLTIVVETSL
jgi:type IV pilus assembly protein PilV